MSRTKEINRSKSIEMQLERVPPTEEGRRERKLNNVKVEYYNYNVGFSWRRLFSWNSTKSSFDRSRHPQSRFSRSKSAENVV